MARDLRGDVVGGLGGLAGQRLDLARDHAEAPPGFARAGRFDGRVERQEIRLRGDRPDEVDHLADGERTGFQALHGLERFLRGGERLMRYIVQLRRPGRDLLDRGGELGRAGGDHSHILRRLVDGGARRARLADGGAGGFVQGCRDRVQILDGLRDLADRLAHPVPEDADRAHRRTRPGAASLAAPLHGTRQGATARSRSRGRSRPCAPSSRSRRPGASPAPRRRCGPPSGAASRGAGAAADA